MPDRPAPARRRRRHPRPHLRDPRRPPPDREHRTVTGQRDIRADAARALARRLAHEPGLRNVELLASELLVILDGQQLGLVDRRRPENPDPVTRPPGTGAPVTS